MPLGLAKDSMLNLAELASKTDDEILLEENSRNKDTNGTSYRKLANPVDDCEEQYGKIKNETDVDNGMDTSMAEAVQAPIHSKITSDDREGTENVSSLTVHSDNNRPSETKSKKSKLRLNTHQYAGFQADYHDFENYTSYNFPGDDTVPTHGGSNNNKDDNPWWQCFFPWIVSENDRAGKWESSGTDDLTEDEEEGPSTKTVDIDDEISMISAVSDNALGSKLPQKNEEAPLEELQLPQPDATKGHSAGDGSFVDETSFTKKSILKRSSRVRDSRNLSTRSNVSNVSNSGQTQQSQRRALFPAYEPKSIKKKNLSASFSPLARVVTIKSSRDMTKLEKSCIWWQKGDYDEFRKTGRMISKVMLQGGSEIWLATNQSWQLPNQGKAATLRRAMANVDNEDTSNKWWHKFGHSRRGLEHIASIDEGRQRQANVKTSIRAILTEQRRQKIFHREDPEKLRMCSIQNTSWAKDLSLASGASDADAVTKNFDEENRKSREFYLLKFSRAGKLNSSSSAQSGTKQVVPAFMKPMISMQLRPNRLDANTTSRLKFKKKEEDKASKNYKRVNLDLPAITASEGGEGPSKPAARVPIHDQTVHIPGRETLASKAAGFANGEKAVNMSAVLTGMGPIPKSPDTTRLHPVLA